MNTDSIAFKGLVGFAFILMLLIGLGVYAYLPADLSQTTTSTVTSATTLPAVTSTITRTTTSVFATTLPVPTTLVQTSVQTETTSIVSTSIYTTLSVSVVTLTQNFTKTTTQTSFLTSVSTTTVTSTVSSTPTTTSSTSTSTGPLSITSVGITGSANGSCQPQSPPFGAFAQYQCVVVVGQSGAITFTGRNSLAATQCLTWTTNSTSIIAVAQTQSFASCSNGGIQIVYSSWSLGFGLSSSSPNTLQEVTFVFY